MPRLSKTKLDNRKVEFVDPVCIRCAENILLDSCLLSCFLIILTQKHMDEKSLLRNCLFVVFQWLLSARSCMAGGGACPSGENCETQTWLPEVQSRPGLGWTSTQSSSSQTNRSTCYVNSVSGIAVYRRWRSTSIKSVHLNPFLAALSTIPRRHHRGLIGYS